MKKKIFAARNPAVTDREREHMAMSRSLAGECVVLLENDGALPLPGVGKLALFGSGARQTIRGGTGSGDVNTRSDVNIEQGLVQAGFTVTTAAWLDRQDAAYRKARRDHAAWIAAEAARQGVADFTVAFSHPFQVIAPTEITEGDLRAADTDTAVYVISRTAGEGADRRNRRGDYRLYEEELAQLRRLADAFPTLVLVLNLGGVIDMSEILSVRGINAVVLLGQLGNIGGLVLGDVLTGRVNPSGKLTDTWAARCEDYPSADTYGHSNGDLDDEYYTEGIYVGYRYFDAFGAEPIYPFGFGRSYTSFSLKPGWVRRSGEGVRLDVKVTNTGPVPGKEVVQLYVSAPEGELEKPVRELVGYAKTELLAPGETGVVTLGVRARDLASYSQARAAWLLEAGDYRLSVGTDSRHTLPAAVLRLDRTVVTEKVKNLFPPDRPVEELHAPARAPRGEFAAPVLTLPADEVKTRHVIYSGERAPFSTDRAEPVTAADVLAGQASVEELTAQLSVRELAELCVGTMRLGEANVIGSASAAVPGAAGDTSAILADRGVPNLIMADGPAGLRLQPVFKTDKEGNLLPGGTVLADSVETFDSRWTDENSDTYYQYCTAIPIGWSLAMSWNLPLIERVGAMVGEEMELFGVDLWLAPAMNIHRNPLCGRNFEYYSEDPFVSGYCAAALTLGVQSHPGKGATIKHYALNNQEDNRYFTNAHVSERAIREIYLRGFRIAVEEGMPLSVMTSYNLLNGVHTANRRDLIQSALRDEFGFEGVVMTDWFTSVDMPMLTGGYPVKYPISASTGCIAAGNDLQMPGCEKNVEDIVRAVTDGEELDGYRITLGDLQFCAANVLRVAIRILGERK